MRLYWWAPASGPAPTNYFIEAGSSSGLSDLAAFPTGNSYTSYWTNVSGGGVFYVRVRAVAAGGMSTPSNEVVVTVANPNLPGAPYGLRVSVTGGTVTLSWYPPSTGAAPTMYVIQAASQPGGPPNLANFATGSTATTFTATGVAPGTYFVRVLAANSAGIGPASPEVSLLVLTSPPPCVSAPATPSNLVSVVNASTVTLGWSPSTGSTSYVVEAGSASGQADLASVDTESSAGMATFTGVARGTYYVRVRAKNACGLSSGSNEILVVVQ